MQTSSVLCSGFCHLTLGILSYISSRRGAQLGVLNNLRIMDIFLMEKVHITKLIS